MIIYIDVPVQNILRKNLAKKLPWRTEFAGVTDGNVFFLFTLSKFHANFTHWRFQNWSTCKMRLPIYFNLYIKNSQAQNKVITISTIICLRNVNMTYIWTSIFFLHLPLGMGNTRGKCKAKYYQQVFKCMQLNKVLSVVTGTYLAGVGFGLGGNHGGGGMGEVVTWNGNFMWWLFSFLATLSSL